MFTREEVASRIDHAVLKPDLRAADVRSHLSMCMDRGVGAVCVRPCDVAMAVSELAGSGCRVCVVVGFPHGASRPEVKALEAELAIADGAVELDMVMNIGQLKSGADQDVFDDIRAVVTVARRGGALLKVILETCLLTDAEIVKACRIAGEAGADYVKTSTGFSVEGATPEAVSLMLDTVGETMKVKASGGIRDWQTAVAYLEQGCSRLGIGSTEAVLDGGRADTAY